VGSQGLNPILLSVGRRPMEMIIQGTNGTLFGCQFVNSFPLAWHAHSASIEVK